MSNEVDLLQAAKDFLRHRKIVAAAAVLGAAAGVAVALLTPPQYESTSKLLPSQNNQAQSQIASIGSMFGLSIGGASSPLDNIPHLLASPLFLDTLTKIQWRTAGTDVRRTLGEIYPIEVETNPKAPHVTKEMLEAEALRGIVLDMVTYENYGNVKSLTVAAIDPLLAHDVNEFLLKYIDTYINSERQTNSRHQLSFVEDRLEEYNRELKKSEYALNRFLDRNRMATSPELQMEQKRLERELRINEAIVTDLRKQLENARIDVEREIEVIDVFQEPSVPMWPVKPKKKLIAAAGLVGGAFAGMCLSFLLCWWKRNGNGLLARWKEG